MCYLQAADCSLTRFFCCCCWTEKHITLQHHSVTMSGLLFFFLLLIEIVETHFLKTLLYQCPCSSNKKKKSYMRGRLGPWQESQCFNQCVLNISVTLLLISRCQLQFPGYFCNTERVIILSWMRDTPLSENFCSVQQQQQQQRCSTEWRESDSQSNEYSQPHMMSNNWIWLYRLKSTGEPIIKSPSISNHTIHTVMT